MPTSCSPSRSGTVFCRLPSVRGLVAGVGKVADMSQDLSATLILVTDTVRALRPRLHEVRHVHTAQAGGEVPALLSRIGGLFLLVRRRQNAEIIGIGTEAIGVSEARHCVAADSDVVEDALIADLIPQRGIAFLDRGGFIELCPSQIVEDRIGVALSTACLLVDKRLNTGVLRRSKRGATCGVGESIGRNFVVARCATLGGIREAE